MVTILSIPFLVKALEKCMLYMVLNIFLESCTYMEMSKDPVLGWEIWKRVVIVKNVEIMKSVGYL